jgi:hypothetical protein
MGLTYRFALLEGAAGGGADLLGDLPAGGLRVVLLHHLLLQATLDRDNTAF